MKYITQKKINVELCWVLNESVWDADPSQSVSIRYEIVYKRERDYNKLSSYLKELKSLVITYKLSL
jgi:hypothetical protein